MTAPPDQSLATPEPALARPPILAQVAIYAGVAVLVGGLGIAQGGYFRVSWAWAALLVFCLLFVLLVAGRPVALTGRQVAFACALILLAVWIAFSIGWSSDPGASVDELERMLAYLAVGLAGVLVLRRSDVHRVLGGILVAIVAVALYSLGTRLFPDRLGSFDPFAVNRLSDPVGYWNALALFVAMGIVLAFGLAAHARRLWPRLLAGAALPVLALTLYFTFGRGGWLALFAGAVAVVAVSPQRLKFLAFSLALSPIPMLTIWLASRSGPLTQERAVLSAEAHDGHRFALLLLLFVALSAAVVGALVVAERRYAVKERVRKGFAVALAVAAAAVVVGVVAAAGGPSALVHKGYDQFKARPENGPDLSGRLFTLTNNGRIDYWHVAWRQFEAHPVAGAGAGTFDEYWFRHRPTGDVVVDAHSLYLESLAELGVVGLGLVAAVFLIPLAAAVRARRHPYVPVLAGAYVAYLVHAVFDWDWEMPVVTVTALLLGSAMLAARARGSRDEPRPLTRRTLGALAGLVVLPIAFSTVALIGNTAMTSAASAVADGNWKSAADDARRARFWAPWSPRPLELLAQAEVGLSHLGAARADLRRAIAKDPGDWRLWQELAGYTSGRPRARAERRLHELNPLGFPKASP